jgi:hypothetical protein
MFSLIPIDTLLVIIFNLTNICDVINLSTANKSIYELFDNNQYFYWGQNLYSKVFWDKAKLRTPIISKPLINMKLELMRIDRFQQYNIKHGYQRWDNEDFYAYWKSLEMYIKNRKTALNINCVKSKSPTCIYYSNEEIDAALQIL